jgi:protein-tyrosine-phosphatase
MNHRIIPIRERFRKRKRLVLFICTGNTCRSPMATGYFRHLLNERGMREVEVRSAGVMTITGLLASQEAVQVMQAEEIDIARHRSTQLTPELIRKADLILAMTPFHRQTAMRLSEEARNKTFLLKEFARSDLKNVQIGDPMGCTLEVFKKCFKEIKAACANLMEHDYILGKTEIARPMSADQAAALRNEAKCKAARKPVRVKPAATGAEDKKTPVKKGQAVPTAKKPSNPARSTARPAARQAARQAARSTARPAARQAARSGRTRAAKLAGKSGKKKPAAKKKAAAKKKPAVKKKPVVKKRTTVKLTPVRKAAAMRRAGGAKTQAKATAKTKATTGAARLPVKKKSGGKNTAVRRG